MILQEVWWFVQNHQTYCLTIWGPPSENVSSVFNSLGPSRVTHICISNLTIIVSDNGFSPGRRQASIWINDRISFIRTSGTIKRQWNLKRNSYSFIPENAFENVRGVTIRIATIRYISRYTTHDMVHDTIQNQLIYYQWKILKHCGMCRQYCYIKAVILARNSEFKINKDVHNHPCLKYLLLTNCVCKQNNKIS